MLRKAVSVYLPKQGALRGLLLGKVPPCLTCEYRKALIHCKRLQTATSLLPQRSFPFSSTHASTISCVARARVSSIDSEPLQATSPNPALSLSSNHAITVRISLQRDANPRRPHVGPRNRQHRPQTPLGLLCVKSHIHLHPPNSRRREGTT